MSRKRQTVSAEEEIAEIREGRYNKNAESKPAGSNALKIKLDHLKTIEPLTENQKRFWEAYKVGTYAIMLTGSPGTGKTMISLYKALEEVMDKSNPFKKVIVCRSATPGRDIGFLPGTEEEKMSAYTQPYRGLCEQLFGKSDAFDRLVEQKIIEVHPTSFLRGVTWDDAVIIFDEFQNAGWQEIKTVISRVGNRSKIILCGDFKQNDLNKSKWDTSGFDEIFKVAEAMDAFEVIQFTPDDILRSSFVKDFIIACEKLGV
jgi:phosphate starvation-inducible PhoH-like protein